VFPKRQQEGPQLRPCIATVVHAWKEQGPVARMHLGNWILQSVYDGKVHPVIVFSNEGWFSLGGEVNSKNGRYWSAENPGLVH